MTTHQAPKMESGNGLPVSQHLPSSQEEHGKGDLVSVPAAIEAACEATVSVIRDPSPEVENSQLKVCEGKGETPMETEEETANKMADNLKEQVTMQGSTGSGGESMDTSEGEKKTSSNPPSSTESPSTMEMSVEMEKAADVHNKMDHPPAAGMSAAPPTTPPTAPPLNSSKPFNCGCGRNFDTQRGLSMHWAHEKGHRNMDPNKPLDDAPSEPTSPQAITPSPLQSPTSAPDSPPYNMASFKTSARNPQYYSIIRTRRSSEHQPSNATVEVGAKRPRGSTSTSTTPPAKTMQLNTGEKVPVGGAGGGGGEEAGEGDKEKEDNEITTLSSPQKRRPRDKEPKKEALSVQQRPRTRSLSSSDNTSPPLKSSLSVPGDMGSGKVGGAGSRSSPVTRSNAATMKTHEFISLPARRRRGGGRRGRGRGVGGAGGRGHDHVEGERDYASTEMDENESHSEDQSKGEDPDPPQQAPPPVKRRRGRPPKNKNKDLPPPSGASKSAPSSTQTTPNVHPTTSSGSAKQTRLTGRGGGRGGRAAMERDSTMEEQEENPLNIKGSKLPPWESESEEQTTKQQSSKASTPSSEPASLPKHHHQSSKSESSSSTATAASSSSKESKTKNHESDSSTTQPQPSRRGRKKNSSSVDGNKVENLEVVEEGEKEIKTRSKAKGSRKASESHSDKDATSNTSSSVKEEGETKDVAASPAVSRPSSVIVSVVSSTGSDKKETATSAESATEEQKVAGQPSQPNGSADDKSTSSSSEGQQFKHSVNESVPPMMGYPPPPTSAPTPTYPYSYQGAYAPPPHLMYPPGPASSMYPYYYHPGTAGSQPPHMMPHPYHISAQGMPPPPVMLPPEQQAGSGTGLPSPHHSMNPFQFQTTAASPNGAPNTTAIAMTSSSTTVGGVRVTLLDKPPTQMPTVTVPHPNVSRQSPTNVYPGHAPMTDHPTSPMGQVPLIRPPYQIPAAAAHSPEGIPPHPLSQVYRMTYPGPLPHPHQAHYPHHHPAHPHLAVRFDAGGHPYMNWEPKPPPPEEQPAQPVECPECHRMFKNNKALNGHMRLHGGFDWTKRPFSVDQKQSSSSSNTDSNNGGSEAEGKGAKTAAAKTKKESRSRSRSRSKSPAPNASSTKQAAKRRTSSEEKSGLVNKKLEGLPVPRAPNIFTFDTKDHHTSSRTPISHHHGDGGMHDAGTMTFSNQPSSHRNATLDDLVRAAEELERIENGSGRKSSHDVGGAETSRGSSVDDAGRRRPENITIPQPQSNPSPAIEREKHRFGATPPYTPPPILSPSRSLTMLATAAGAPQPCTPSRILHPWTSRRSSEGHKPSESEDSYTEPKINVGSEFQAVLPECSPTHTAAAQDDYRATKVWEPLKELTHEDESIMDGYLQLACSPAVLYGGRNMELAYHFLYQLRGSVKEAVRVLLSGKSVFPEGNPMTSYNYCGSKRWSGKERQQFRRAWRVHRKQFQLLRSAVDSKGFQEVTEFYYTWKKYCSDEYRGRNRHTSEEILSDEDNAYPQVPSSGSSASVENETPDGSEMDHSSSSNQNQIYSSKNDKPRNNKNSGIISHVMAPPTHPSVGGPGGGYHPPRHYTNASGGMQHHMDYDPFPVVYSAHKHGQVNQYKCKYPGCNQVFTSIFALNGHIRVHGGSFYPRPSSGSSSSSASSHHHASNTNASSSYSSKSHGGHQSQKSSFDSRSPQQLDIAKALLDLPQSRSPARGGGSYSSPSSQKSSPGKSRSPATTKKKMSSSSPGEREGYYPCNRCGRVFTKVKSRSAHMKSHIIKQN